MTPYLHQIEGAKEAYPILQENGIVYLAWEERTGKSLTSLLIAEMSKAKKVLILTKKKALDGWKETLDNFEHKKYYFVTNYHQAVKIVDHYDLIILDESHSYLSAYPKKGKLWKDVAKLTREKPLIYLSATPYAQGPQLLYHQLALSSWSPWRKYRSFYDWFREFGIPHKVRTAYGLAETYSKVEPHTFLTVKHLFITKTRKELNFEHEPEDILHYVELDESTKSIYNHCLKSEMLLAFDEAEQPIEGPLDSSMKLRTTLHMLEGGVAKIDDNYYILPNEEKIDAIKRDFGDTSSMVIMYQYIAEGKKLRRRFKNAEILQGTSFAEGIDLSRYECLIIYSQDFSTARHSQRRARQANKLRDLPIKVHFYLVKEGISEQIYETVSINKLNFIDKLFNKKEI